MILIAFAHFLAVIGKKHPLLGNVGKSLPIKLRIQYSTFLILFKNISEALSANDVLGIRTYFLSQSSYIDIHCALGDDNTIPNAVHELLS